MEINNINSHTLKPLSFPCKTNIERNSHYFTYRNSRFNHEKNKDILLKTSLAALACVGMIGSFRVFNKPNDEYDFNIPEVQIDEADVNQEEKYDEVLNGILNAIEETVLFEENEIVPEYIILESQAQQIDNYSDLSVDDIMKRNQKICRWVDLKTQNGFYDKCIIIARELNFDANDFVSLLYCQSCFNPKAEKNWHVGLAQLDSAMLGKIGYNYWDVEYMSPLNQLDVIGKYLKYIKTKKFDINEKIDAADLYSLFLFPDSIGKQVLCSKKDDIYQDNSQFDYNSDGYITKADLNSIVQETFNKICECAQAN